MNLTRNQAIVILSIGTVILLFALMFLGVIPGFRGVGPKQNTAPKLTLNVWTVGDQQDNYQLAFSGFSKIYPNVSFAFRSFPDITTYESSLLDALAAGSGPDIFMVRNDKLGSYLNKIVAAPTQQFTQSQLQQAFPETVANDFVRNGALYGLPVSIDDLALLYNRDLLDRAAVPVPTTWDDLVAAVPALTKYDSGRNITQAAVALGTGTGNISRAADILELLFLQHNVAYTDQNLTDGTVGLSSPDAANAVNFYTQFSDANSSAYTWNSSLPQDTDFFAAGHVAMILDYASDLPAIKAQNAFLNLGVAPVLQSNNAQVVVDLPRYFGYVVSRQSPNQAWAWNFILWFSTNPSVAKTYLDGTGGPPALRSLIQTDLGDSVLGPFARQALIARAWAPLDATAVGSILSSLIDGVVNSQLPAAVGLQTAQTQIKALQGGNGAAQ